MKGLRLYHPWWTHLPAIILFAASAAVFASGASIPGPWPMHWNAAGQPDGYGRAWWEFPFLALAGGLMMLTIGAAFDGLWAQYENGRKRFNPFCVIDELGLTLVFAMALGYADWLRHHPQPLWQPPVRIAGIVAVMAAFLLEIRRPAGSPITRPPVDTSALVRDLSLRQAAGQRWVYWSEQAPFWIRLMMVIPVGFAVMFVVVPPPTLLLGGCMALAAAGASVLSGGFRTQVTPAGLVLRVAWGPRLLRLAPSEIAEVEACQFNPMREFGGWGIRRGHLGGRGVWGFYLEGNTGVLIRTKKDKRYLIGTNEPERLLAVLNVARGVAIA